jgi:hypothetical protein
MTQQREGLCPHGAFYAVGKQHAAIEVQDEAVKSVDRGWRNRDQVAAS